MSVEKYFHLDKEQQIAVEVVIAAIKKAFDTGVGVSALTFAIEDANCGLTDLMSRVAQEMYKQDGLLGQRCVEYGAAKNAKELGKTLEVYMSEVQQFAQKDYRI